MAVKTQKQGDPSIAKQKEEKAKAVDLAISYLDKQFGKGTLMRLGQKAVASVEAIPTGSMIVDAAIGVGGLPKGRIIEIYGPESSGKTTFALSVIAECQAVGGVCAFIDAEHALDTVYAKNLGVDINNLLIAQPDNGEQALEIADTLVRSGGVDVIVVDSVAALVPKQELEGDMDQVTVGMQARLMSRSLRKLTASVSKTGTVLIFINQLRMKIGGYGNPETTTGGVALKFYASVRIEVRPSGAITKGDDRTGVNVRIKIVKNKVAAPFKQGEISIMFGYGIDKEAELIFLGEKAGIFTKSGSWYSYNGERIGQGKETLKQYLLDNKNVTDAVRKKIVESTSILTLDDDNEGGASIDSIGSSAEVNDA